VPNVEPRRLLLVDGLKITPKAKDPMTREKSCCAPSLATKHLDVRDTSNAGPSLAISVTVVEVRSVSSVPPPGKVVDKREASEALQNRNVKKFERLGA